MLSDVMPVAVMLIVLSFVDPLHLSIRKRLNLLQMYSDYEQAMFMQVFSKLTYPASYTKHVSFLDFELFDQLSKRPQLSGMIENKSFQYLRPIYVNMVREPVNRIISWCHSDKTFFCLPRQ